MVASAVAWTEEGEAGAEATAVAEAGAEEGGAAAEEERAATAEE